MFKQKDKQHGRKPEIPGDNPWRPRWVRGIWNKFLYDKLDIVDKKIDQLLKGEDHGGHKTLTVNVISIEGKSPMATLPPLKMLDVEKVQLSVAPQLANGEPDTTVDVSWESSDPSQVSVEPAEDDRSCFCLTPLETGVATVTVSAPGYESVTIEISYAPGVPRSLNATIGSPVPDA